MKLLAIEKEVSGVDWNTVSKELLVKEALNIYKIYLTEQLREHYFNENKSAVLILECESKAHARNLLEKLPLVAEKLISFEIMELHPYTGYDRIIQDTP